MAPVVCLLAVAAAFVGSVDCEPFVNSSFGTISGRSDSFEDVEVESFLGIPYAKPPLGDLRFAYPQVFGPVGELNASQFSSKCHQRESKSTSRPASAVESEDCLYLNVFRKAGTQADAKKAVLFVIHGGAFTEGSSSDESYNAKPMVALGDVIVVSINYRLGIFGFADMKDLAPGNLGFFDQLLALEWVHENIAAFGGCPHRVTLVGVSAGSISVAALLASPLVRGKNLFRGVFMDAGVMSRTSIMTQDYTLNRMKEIAGKVGCGTEGGKMLSCLRNVNATRLIDLSSDLETSSIFTFIPTVDGKFVPVDPTKYVQENPDKFPDVRMIIGVTKDEGTMFAAMVPEAQKVETETEFVALSEKMSKNLVYPLDFDKKEVKAAVTQTYFGKSVNHFHDISDFITDGTFACPTDHFVKEYSSVHKNVFVYRFERTMKTKGILPGMNDPELLGAFHGSPFIHMFGSCLAFSGETPLDADDKQFSMDSVKMLADFAKSDAVPQLRGVTWPNYSSGEGILVINDNTTVSNSLGCRERCQKVFPFLDAV
ncbi:cholinesterase 1 [Galendromus occidentalis]|uniref:Carboxylic ester hydrolase n=1 Tax=Galendromus occidentalis TaxID=34638 RepID=A0AAJ6QUF2_9ACAR|nr:cholinesterase 1 [Galendromus occidentalis]